MKYIKTNDNIYPFDNPRKYCDILKKEFYEIGDEHVYLEDIIKGAYTIKELCDEFVVIVIDKNIPYRPSIIYGVDITDFAKNNKGLCDIYGAIWTDKGLIYVAKMNEKGELELI